MLRRLGAGFAGAGAADEDHGAPCVGWVITTPPAGAAVAPTAIARGVGAPSWMSTPDAVPLLWKDDLWRRLPSSVPDCDFDPPPPSPSKSTSSAVAPVCVRAYVRGAVGRRLMFD